jgi:hypothetical protein
VSDHRVLGAVVAIHLALLAIAVIAAPWAGLPAGGVLAGGAAAGVSFALLWGLAHALVRTRNRVAIVAFGTLKTLFYAALAVALFRGVRLDGAAFASGVTCFVVAAIAGSLLAVAPGPRPAAGH